MAHALVVYNPVSGSAADPDLWLGSVVHRACENYTVTVLPTRADMKPEEIFSAINNDIDLIIAAGAMALFDLCWALLQILNRIFLSGCYRWALAISSVGIWEFLTRIFSLIPCMSH